MTRLRNFEMGDLAGMYALDQVCFPPEIAYSHTELHYFATHPRCACWVAEGPDRHLAGFLILERQGRRRRAAGHIITLDVDPAERRLGLGRLLMQAAEARMRAENALILSLEVAVNNVAARQFYRSLGFAAVGTIANYYGGRIDAEVMEKAIDSPLPTSP
jgi:ribosomal-protein-alanine N-acetyltransferase